MRTVVTRTHLHISIILIFRLRVVSHRSEVRLLALERHIVLTSNHRTIAKYIQAKGDILLPECKFHKSPTELGIIHRHIKTLHAATHNTTHGTESAHTITVIRRSYGRNIWQNVPRSRLADSSLVVNTIGEGQHVILDDRHIVTECSRVAVVGIGRTEPLRSEHHVSLCPDTARGRTLLIACIEHQAEAHLATKSAISLLFGDNAPIAVLLVDGRHIGREFLVISLILIDFGAVDISDIEVTEMVARLPEEFFVPYIAHKVGLKEQSQSLETILGRKLRSIALLILTNLHSRMVVI